MNEKRKTAFKIYRAPYITITRDFSQKAEFLEFQRKTRTRVPFN